MSNAVSKRLEHFDQRWGICAQRWGREASIPKQIAQDGTKVKTLSSGFKGIGGIQLCLMCFLHLSFADCHAKRTARTAQREIVVIKNYWTVLVGQKVSGFVLAKHANQASNMS